MKLKASDGDSSWGSWLLPLLRPQPLYVQGAGPAAIVPVTTKAEGFMVQMEYSSAATVHQHEIESLRQ